MGNPIVLAWDFSLSCTTRGDMRRPLELMKRALLSDKVELMASCRTASQSLMALMAASPTGTIRVLLPFPVTVTSFSVRLIQLDELYSAFLVG